MRIALLSNITVDLLADMLKKTFEVYLPSGFDGWQQEILLPTSGLYEFQPEAVVILLHADACKEIWNSKKEGEKIIDEWCEVITHFVEKTPGIPVFVSSIDIVNNKCFYGSEERLNLFYESIFIRKIQSLHETGKRVYILPVKDTITNIGRNNYYSSKMWYWGSMPYSLKGLAALNDLIVRYVSASKGMKKKCIAVDLDNTLWGGVIGEEGVDGIVLSENGEGARYKDLQRLLKKIKGQGVLLAILSKNNIEDVEPVFNHPHMILQREDFVAEMINWEPKCENIKHLAENLNVGMDAFVFLDDNPIEREQMKEAWPEVSVVEFPKDSSMLSDSMTKAYEEYFLSLEVTEEDANKTSMYHAQEQRENERKQSVSLEEFLKKLDMVMEIHYVADDEIKRVTQLVNKTNQFNLTTRRYSEEEICAFSSSKENDVITVHLADKYGDQGLVAVIILKYEGSNAEIDSFLMSCRVMGRSVETEIVSQLKNGLKKKGIDSLKAVYLKTNRNSPVKELYESLGFETVRSDDSRKEYITKVDDLPESTGFFKEVINKL